MPVINIDKNRIDEAVQKASKQGVASNMTDLIKWLLHKFNTERDNFKFDYMLEWEPNIRSSALISADELKNVKDHIESNGVKPKNDFVVRFLIGNYLNWK